jgi:hypothetical protein
MDVDTRHQFHGDLQELSPFCNLSATQMLGCSDRDCLRWDALGNRPLIFAANGRSFCVIL